MKEEDLKKILAEAIESYNRYRGPEAEARMVRVKYNELVVDFSGPFCWGCGTYEYFEDLIYEVRSISQVEMKVVSYEPLGAEKFRVKYLIGSF